MDGLWVSSNPAKLFLDKLRRKRAIEFMRNQSYLRQLRYNHEMAERDQRAFGKIWKEYGTDVNQLIAEAWGENWDFEDEEKNAFAREAVKKEAAVKQNKDDNLAPARQTGSRRGLDQLQGISRASWKKKKGSSEAPKKKAPKKKRGKKAAEEEQISIEEQEEPVKKKKRRRRAKKASPDLPAKDFKNIDSRSLR